MKCATITPDEARVEEFGLKKMWRSPNGTIRNILGGVVFREPIICSNIPRLVPGLDEADRHRPSRPRRPVQGHRLQGARRRHRDHDLHPGRRRPSRWRCEVADSSPGGGVAMGMYNFNDSIRDFARASLRYGLDPQLPGVPVDEEHDPQGLRRPVQGPLPGGLRRPSSRPSSTPPGITYEHRLIDDMVAAGHEVGGRLRLGLQELRRRRAVRHRRPGLRLARPDDVGADDARRQDRRGRGRARHRDPPLPRAPEGQPDLDQPDRVDLRLDRRPQAPRQARRHARGRPRSPRRSSGSASRPSRAGR